MVSFVKTDDYYRGVNQKVFDMITPGTKKILDVGCGTGEMGKKLKEEKAVEQVIGIEIVPEIAREANSKLDRVFRTDVETARLESMRKYFDCIVMSGILHHLRDPWSVLKRFRDYLKDDGYLVACVPNVAHISIIKDLLKGRWAYKNEGLLDVCHMKFFTLEEMTKMFGSSGYKPVEIQEEIQDFSPENIDLVKRLKSSAEVGPNFSRDSFVFQFISKWVKKPESN